MPSTTDLLAQEPVDETMATNDAPPPSDQSHTYDNHADVIVALQNFELQQ